MDPWPRRCYLESKYKNQSRVLKPSMYFHQDPTIADDAWWISLCCWHSHQSWWYHTEHHHRESWLPTPSKGLVAIYLFEWNTTGQQLDQITSFDDNVTSFDDIRLITIRILRLSCGLHGHCTLDAVQLTVNIVFLSNSRTSRQFECTCNSLVTRGQTSFKYFSLYLGNIVAKELSSNRELGMYSSFHS